MLKKCFVFILVVFVSVLMLTACSKNSLTGDSNSSAVSPSNTMNDPLSSRSPESATPMEHPYLAEPVDLSLLHFAYVAPLFTDILSYSWSDIAQIEANHFIELCNRNNYLNLWKDSEGVYGSPDTPADHMEWAIQMHFDVDSEYLRTSQFYNPSEHTYDLFGGFGGGLNPIALSYEQKGTRIFIEVGFLDEFTGRSLEAGETMTENGIIRPMGTLELEFVYGKYAKYISYSLYNQST